MTALKPPRVNHQMTSSVNVSKDKNAHLLGELRFSLRGCLVSVPFLSDWKQRTHTHLAEQLRLDEQQNAYFVYSQRFCYFRQTKP